MEVKKLTEEEISSRLKLTKGWEIKNNKLHRLFKFKTFNQAINFIVEVSRHCEEMNHHPEWSNVYGNVDVMLTTHRVSGITELDFKLAEIMNSLFERNI